MQVLLFSMNASALKQRAPGARTYLEVIRCRWGKLGHISFLFFGLCTNLLVSAMLITGGSSSVSALTGMPIRESCSAKVFGLLLTPTCDDSRRVLSHPSRCRHLRLHWWQ